jgi:hypothetical protein
MMMINQVNFVNFPLKAITKGKVSVCYFIADIKDAKLIGIGKEIEEITGYSMELFQSSSLKFFKKLIVSSDWKKLETARRLIFFYGRKQEEPNKSFSISESVNLKHVLGHIINIDMEITIVQYDKNGFPQHVIGEIKYLKTIDTATDSSIDSEISPLHIVK